MSFATLNFHVILADARLLLRGHDLELWLEFEDGVAVKGEPMETTAEWLKSALRVKVALEAAIGQRQLACLDALVSNDAYKQLPARTLVRDRVNFIRQFLGERASEVSCWYLLGLILDISDYPGHGRRISPEQLGSGEYWYGLSC
jgi:hypothetical protein